jgi:hypothetical protein
MKLRLQLSSMLPASVKPGPTGSHGKGAFDTALQEMMATSPSNKASLGAMAQGWPSGQAQMGTYAGLNKPDQAIDEAHRVPAAAPHQQSADQTELFKEQIVQHPGSGGSPVPKEALPEPPAQDPILEEPLLETSIARQLPGVIFEPDVQQPRQRLAGAISNVSGSTQGASPPVKDKTKAMRDGETHSANGQSSDALSASPPPVDLVVPVPALQPDGSWHVPSSSSSNATNSAVRGQGALHRARVQPMASGESGLRGNPVSASEAQTMVQAPVMGANGAAKVLEGVPTKGSSAQSTDPQLTPPTNGKTNTVAGVQANQALHSKATHSQSDGVQATASQMDSGPPKDSEGKIGTEVKLEIKASVPSHAVPIPSAAQHQRAPNDSPAVFQGTEKSTVAHRPETSAAQVLQRMDMEPSGAVQLRADARRLDVGVSSAALGWVEVKATTGRSGRVDATVHLQNDVSAQDLTIRSKDISDYAREHSVQLGQVSVGVGTGDSARGDSRPARNGAGDENETEVRGAVRPLARRDQSYRPEEPVSLISVRA